MVKDFLTQVPVAREIGPVRRALVLTDETARHPFLMRLPPHVRRGSDAKPARPQWRLSSEDVKQFLMAYSACFLAVSAWLG
ncbi:hypothetical protein C0V78_01485 [Novosphingobium sp. TH158]|nr:hypothetical protein C0V78_01485 [Novosphingobium sp. TH158]